MPAPPTASQMVARTIGELTIQNANLIEQVNNLQAELAALKKKLPPEREPH